MVQSEKTPDPFSDPHKYHALGRVARHAPRNVRLQDLTPIVSRFRQKKLPTPFLGLLGLSWLD
jgi:hypothetical protein